MRTRRLVLATAVLGLSFVVAAPSSRAAEPAAAPAAAEKTYPVVLHRTSKVGDRYKLDAMGAMRRKLTLRAAAGDPKTSEVGFGVRLDGVVKVTAVNKAGRETQVECEVAECVLSDGKQFKPILPPGSVVIAVRQEKGVKYAIKGGPDVPEAVAEVLELVLDISDPDGATDDAIFGSKEKRRVGDAWPLDAAAAVKELDRIGLAVREEDVFGETTLMETARVGDQDCLRFGIRFKARKLKGNKKDADGDVRMVDGSYAVTGKVTLPLDPAKAPVQDEAKLDIVTTLAGKDEDGKPVTILREVERLTDRKLQKIK